MKKSVYRCVIFILFTVEILVETHKFCSTPDEWMGIQSDDEDDAAAQNYRSTRVGWPGGIVKYTLSSSLTFNDTLLVFSAFKEYHTKTCIRFVPKTDSDENYVSIQFDPDSELCGKAQVCMRGGYQYVKFGKNCRNKGTLVHELGHAVCLEHEHQRADRDNYVTVDDTCGEFNHAKQNKRRSVRGFYDYASQMHYACGDCVNAIDELVVGCGEQVTPGLSLLDADYINELYNCSGCQGHRWVRQDLHNVNSTSLEMTLCDSIQCQLSVVPCRAQMHGSLIVGGYDRDSQTCDIYFKGKMYNFGRNFEIFHVEQKAGFSEKYKYSWIEINADTMSTTTIKYAFKYAVPGGHLLSSNIPLSFDGYIGYGLILEGNTMLIEKKSLLKEKPEMVCTLWTTLGKKVPRWYVPAAKSFLPRKYHLLVCKPGDATAFLEDETTLKNENERNICPIGRSTLDFNLQAGLFSVLEVQQTNNWYNTEQIRGKTFCDCFRSPDNAEGLLEYEGTCLQSRSSSCKAERSYQSRELGMSIDLVRFLSEIEVQVDDLTYWFQLIPADMDTDQACTIGDTILDWHSQQMFSLAAIEQQMDDEWLAADRLLEISLCDCLGSFDGVVSLISQQSTCLQARSPNCKGTLSGKLENSYMDVLNMITDLDLLYDDVSYWFEIMSFQEFNIGDFYFIYRNCFLFYFECPLR